ncbi:MAG: hypothetical protein ACPG3W_09110 [Synechococcus sp.]|jgi:hypothetical protein|uniref:hypothetical protein n=1 Tax=Synechococcus sp. BMK-MC-1 TaxID=1442551 RepID=UPI00164763BB|nr:hypothetical protein [Synechococcus sp. BMK-MC-1]QNI67913.1 hypothetical protein SynBMKMC1_01842 [Synechococcus sp. BMK-MC-1]
MANNLLVVIGAGRLGEGAMAPACRSLADAFGATLIERGSGASPHACLQQITSPSAGGSSQPTLLRVSGDVAVDECGEGSWLEALACWRVPVLLLAEPRKDGRFAGVVPGAVALSRALQVELLGLVQLGGTWSRSARRADGLPWCGCLQGPDEDLSGLISCLRSRWAQVAKEEGPDRA